MSADCKCFNSAVIDAPIDDVWAAIADFHGLTSWAAPVVSSCVAVGDADGTTVGAQRVINDAFHETLTEFDADAYTFTYQITDGPGPVAKDACSAYFGVVKLHPVTLNNTTFFEWSSTCKTDDEGAVHELCNPIYQALLGQCATHFATSE